MLNLYEYLQCYSKIEFMEVDRLENIKVTSDDIKNSLHNLDIDEILDKVDLSMDRKELLRQFLSYRLRWFV